MTVKTNYSIIIIFLILIILFNIGILSAFTGSSQAVPNDSLSENLDLKITEHRITIQQEEELNRLTVIDEFWIMNSGSEPYYDYVYNSLPEGISIQEGMTCKVSETGGHQCFSWEHINNNYYWATSYVILPKNYATEFGLEITATSLTNQSNNSIVTINKRIDQNLNGYENLIEEDGWGWVRDGFYRGWRMLFNFSVTNSNNNSELYEINSLKIPPGVLFEVYIDSNKNNILDRNDTLLAYDMNFDGSWDPNPDFDSNQNDIPDISIEANRTETFHIFLKADYGLHFYSKFQKTLEPSNEGIITYTKKTLYDTSLMRLFVVPTDDEMIIGGDVSFRAMGSVPDTYYYGEWNGAEGSEININLIGNANIASKSQKENDGQNSLIVILVLIVMAIILIGIMVSKASGKKDQMKDVHEKPDRDLKTAQVKRDISTNNSAKIDKVEYQRLLEKRKKLVLMIKRIQKKDYDDDEEREIELSLSLELEKKLKKIDGEIKNYKRSIADQEKMWAEQKRKYNVALIQLEEDYLAGEVDEDIYRELKNKYSENN